MDSILGQHLSLRRKFSDLNLRQFRHPKKGRSIAEGFHLLHFPLDGPSHNSIPSDGHKRMLEGFRTIAHADLSQELEVNAAV